MFYTEERERRMLRKLVRMREGSKQYEDQINRVAKNRQERLKNG